MKKNTFLHLCPLLLIVLLCTACPYESQIFIDKPTTAVDTTLLGVWKNESEREKPDHFDIRKADEFTYLITENTYRKEDRILLQKRYKGHISLVDGKQYLNIKMIKDSINITVSDNYLLYKVEMELEDKAQKKIILLPLSQYIREKFVGVTELQAFIKQYQHLSFFYGERTAFIKVND
jgi:hypothetical protein